MSNDFLKNEKWTLNTEDNSYGEIASPVIEITFYNDYIHEWNEMPKLYIYGCFILKLIGSEEKSRT